MDRDGVAASSLPPGGAVVELQPSEKTHKSTAVIVMLTIHFAVTCLRVEMVNYTSHSGRESRLETGG